MVFEFVLRLSGYCSTYLEAESEKGRAEGALRRKVLVDLATVVRNMIAGALGLLRGGYYCSIKTVLLGLFCQGIGKEDESREEMETSKVCHSETHMTRLYREASI